MRPLALAEINGGRLLLVNCHYALAGERNGHALEFEIAADSVTFHLFEALVDQAPIQPSSTMRWASSMTLPSSLWNPFGNDDRFQRRMKALKAVSARTKSGSDCARTHASACSGSLAPGAAARSIPISVSLAPRTAGDRNISASARGARCCP